MNLAEAINILDNWSRFADTELLIAWQHVRANIKDSRPTIKAKSRAQQHNVEVSRKSGFEWNEAIQRIHAQQL